MNAGWGEELHINRSDVAGSAQRTCRSFLKTKQVLVVGCRGSGAVVAGVTKTVNGNLGGGLVKVTI